MQRLIDGGHAYAAGGDVYFDVHSQPGYGELSGQRLEHMRAAADTDDSGAKRDPRDFALWKGAKPGEPTWPTPWGPGRPGWHLECSAMSTKYLGATFDIHGGGLDLLFPHHENEQAQSHAAGDGFARYWLHNGLVRIGGEKMSKSLGNSLLVDEMVTRVRPVELRYYLGQAHYRSPIDYSPEALGEAATAYRRIEGFVTRAAELLGGEAAAAVDLASLPAAFTAAMDDDLGVPQALAIVHDSVRDGNAAIAAGDAAGTAKHLAQVRAMLSVLGLDPLAAPWASCSGQRRPAARSGRARQRRARAAASSPRAQGLRCRRRHQGPAPGGRRAGRGHPARPAMGACADERARSRRGRRPDQVGQAAAGHRRLRASASWRARARRRPRRCGRDTRPEGAAAQARKTPASPGRGRPVAAQRPGRRARGCYRRTGRRAGSRPVAGSSRGPSRAGDSRARGAGSSVAELVAGRNPVLEALRARVPATALHVGPRLDSDERIGQAVLLADRSRHPGRRGRPVRARPDHWRRDPPGTRAADQALLLRRPRRPRGRRAGCGCYATDRGARRRH